MNRFQFFAALCAAFMPAPAANAAVTAKYDPLAVDANFRARPLELVVHDAKRNRDVPVRVYLPASVTPAPVVLFSHGLGGSRKGNEFLGQHWAARGYVAVFVQHPGSDNSVWKDKPPADRMGAMREAAALQNFSQRSADVPAVLDQLEVWNAERKERLAGRMDLRKIGMSGHSFGAVTTQAVSGETFPMVGAKLTDPRIKAAIAFSPSAPAGRILQDIEPAARIESDAEDRDESWAERLPLPVSVIFKIFSAPSTQSPDLRPLPDRPFPVANRGAWRAEFPGSVPVCFAPCCRRFRCSTRLPSCRTWFVRVWQSSQAPARLTSQG